MNTIKSVSLRDQVESGLGINFLAAEWWDENSRFVVIRILYLGEERTLRMDLFKGAFLDHFPDGEVEDFVQENISTIIALVGQGRGWARDLRQPEAAY